ncbi:MAG TPA: hypothetical protein VGC42_16575 [Kofleriaceae bacterium]
MTRLRVHPAADREAAEATIWYGQGVGSHTSIPQLRTAISTYVEAHYDNGKPFKWTKTADETLEKVKRFGRRTQQVHDRSNSRNPFPGD